MAISRRLFHRLAGGSVPALAGSSSGGLASERTSGVVRSIADLRNTSIASDLVFSEGFAAPGDGGGGFFFWSPNDERPDDGAMIVARPDGALGRWVRQHTFGEIDVRWFGARGDGQSDDTLAFEKARDFAKSRSRKDPQLATDPLGSIKIRIPSGTYLITRPEAMLDRDWPSSTLGLSYEGAGAGISAINYRPARAGSLFFNNNAVLYLRLSGILFACNDGLSVFYEAVSAAKAQDVRCDDIVWNGSWSTGFKLSGTNTNSEYKWTACTIAGSWDYFLDLDGNDQLLNYWFTQCKFWVTRGGGWVRARRGGHIKISECDVSGWIERTGRPLFALLGTAHARGVCHFLCIGSRFEIRADNAPIIRSQWPHGVISFINVDFGSQAPWRSHDYVEASFEIGPAGHAMVRWQDCSLIGRHTYAAIQSPVPTSLSEAYRYLADPIRTQPRVMVQYDGCTHLSAATPDEMVVLDEALSKSSNSPLITFNNCRSENVRDGRPVLPWTNTFGWNSSRPSIICRKTECCSLFLPNLTGLRASVPQGALITKVQLCILQDTTFKEQDFVSVSAPGPEVVLYEPAKSEGPDGWLIPDPGNYLVRVVVSGRSKGSLVLRDPQRELGRVSQNGPSSLLFSMKVGEKVTAEKDSEFDGKLERIVVRRLGARKICEFDGRALQSSSLAVDNLSFLVDGFNGGILDVAASIGDHTRNSSDKAWGIVLIDFLG
ncbi:hypothetical protein IC762_12780 [Bradyrhizobium genosp. L]|uniref:glycosyl hydrolase family 28-related protein n=1 Tax=Bradyrhizobium genosp. L TaxID=83637 RepID=UPI0018A29AFD|nr:glycosyl hydrolase family 28-related protein [Bradyrhizobium genosp. L]QPF87112.1 hypothetical protein IC762_12780 [Bradyrhizobium genosp. L]